MPGVDSASQVEVVLADELDEVLVHGNSAGFKGFGSDLFHFVGDAVDHSLVCV
jgi:hypothetical protein